MAHIDGRARVDASCLPLLLQAALDAGRAILRRRDEGFRAELKADRSPVTAADRAAEETILRALDEHFPGVPVVAEEACSAGAMPSAVGERFFLVDPLDGTREFIAGRDEYTVNIALIDGRRPLCGVVVAPALFLAFTGGPGGAFRAGVDAAGEAGTPEPIHVRARPARPVALASRSHRTPETDRYLGRLSLESVVALGSSLKFCRLAEGRADIYPCLGRTMEWDTAAGQAVLEAAGGRVMAIDGGPLCYGKRDVPGAIDFANPHFVATGHLAIPNI